MTQVEINKQVIELIKALTEKVKILQAQVNKHEITIAGFLSK